MWRREEEVVKKGKVEVEAMLEKEMDEWNFGGTKIESIMYRIFKNC